MARSTVRLEGRKLSVEKLVSGKKMVFKVNDKADWTREVTTNNCLTSQPLKKWVVVYVAKNADVVKNFVSLMIKLAPKMGIQVAQPAMLELPNDRPETYVTNIRNSVDPSVQLVCAVMPTPRDDRYAAVKKLCCVEKPLPCEVINFKTISNEKKVNSAVQKVALQITTPPASCQASPALSPQLTRRCRGGTVVPAFRWELKIDHTPYVDVIQDERSRAD